MFGNLSAFTISRRVREPLEQPEFLPMSRVEMDALGWTELDVLLVSGDAYVDHPSFGIALLGRWLVAHGLRTGVIAQPAWEDDGAAIRAMGRPRLLAGVSAGALDSMLAHYTAFRKLRRDDAYTPGGKHGARPNRAVTVYANLVRRAFPGLPLVAGGIEASLRRLTHYDFWTDALRRSVLFDARLDLLICGMGEQALLEAVQRLDAHLEKGALIVSDLPRLWADIPGTARIIRQMDMIGMLKRDPVRLPSHEEQADHPEKFLEATLAHERHSHQAVRPLVQPSGDRAVWLEPPAPPLTEEELDRLYALPFTRRPHPSYSAKIPAAAMIADSITSHRGCAGGCSFCSLALHQGRRIASRSRESLLAEAARLAALPGFSGSVSDVGGPSANMWRARCLGKPETCSRPSCLFPEPCPSFAADQGACVDMLDALAALPGIKHVRVASGIRFDLALADRRALAAYTGRYTGGQLKVAPEHCRETVLRLMRKPGMDAFERFLAAFSRQSKAEGKQQYVVPYLMSAFPGCTDEDMKALAAWLSRRHWAPQQVQCFIPTPGTVATAMFYSGLDVGGKPLSVARSDAERLRQHGFLSPATPKKKTGRSGSRSSAGKTRTRSANGKTGKTEKSDPR